jgi:hypothetical protein
MRKIDLLPRSSGKTQSTLRPRKVFPAAYPAARSPTAVTGKLYEITVRFRDGSTTVLNEASPRTWRLSNRVIVIGRSNAENN